MELQTPPVKPLWPTLGPGVARFIEETLVFGPGDLRGEPASLDDEQRSFIYRFYEVHPRGSERAGRRRFQRCAISLRKGTRKTELLAWLSAAELHPESPVRTYAWRCQAHRDEPGSCEGIRKNHAGAWEPVGRGVTDPYIPLVAYTEEQSDELAYGALLAILSHENCAISRDFDLGLARIVRRDGTGKAESLATAPNSRDGARTTFEGFDETHRMTLDRQRRAHQVMLANLLKRPLADPWALETTTMYQPGEGSVAESTYDYARRVLAGEVNDSRLFFFHRQASDNADIATRPGLRAAVVEASGITAEWSDIDGIVAQWDDPDADKAYLDRIWLNRAVMPAARAFDAERWRGLERKGQLIAARSWITLGFDGSRTRDATALIACDVATGYMWPLGIWARPEHAPADWEVDREAVDAAVSLAMKTYRVWRMNADPPYWETEIRGWMGRYGDELVVEFPTASSARIGPACRAFANAIARGDVSHSGNPALNAHIGNSIRKPLSQAFDAEGNQLWTIQKDRQGSPNKIDAAMAAVLAWDARTRALAAGVGRRSQQVGAFVA